jgi:hypothetical protein
VCVMVCVHPWCAAALNFSTALYVILDSLSVIHDATYYTKFSNSTTTAAVLNLVESITICTTAVPWAVPVLNLVLNLVSIDLLVPG